MPGVTGFLEWPCSKGFTKSLGRLNYFLDRRPNLPSRGCLFLQCTNSIASIDIINSQSDMVHHSLLMCNMYVVTRNNIISPVWKDQRNIY